ncbi:MAG: M20 family metallopeptidase [Acidimicrobiia bacterium]|nr:M20 family metallopeptidase [Acidimicrobiia bacterium]
MTYKDTARDRFDRVEPDLQGLSRWMYEHPEVAFEEHETSARMAELLAANGLEVEYPAFGLDTAFAARVGSEGPEVIICAEMDALPEVGHACGHNVIGTAAMGAGIALAPIADELGVRITVLGTPAEEHLGGKVDLIQAGAFEGATAAMMIHPSTKDIVDPAFLAVKHIDVEFRGKSSHASGAPDLGINALDAAVQAYVNVSTLRQQLEDSDRVHGIITYGGAAPNIIPAVTTMAWYVRATTDDRLAEIYPRVVSCFEAAAIATGCSFEVRQSGHEYADLRSAPVLVDLYAENSAALGRRMYRLSELPPETSGSTDMGNVSHVVPSIHPMLDLHCYPTVNHQPEFAAHTTTADGDAAIRDGALAMAWTIIDLAEGDRWSDL